MDEQFDTGGDYALLGRFLSGEATVAEREAVAAWLAENDENQGILDDLEKLWDASEPSEQRKPDREAAWKKVKARTTGQGGGTIRSFRPARYWYAAAAAVLVAAVGLFLLTRSPGSEGGVTEYAAADAPLTVKLADGSEVRLEAGSKLTVAEGFGSENRQLSLAEGGEARFEVAKDSSLPFEVAHAGVTVRVLGTVFSLKGSDKAVKLEVEEGRVSFARRDSAAESMVVSAGERARYDVEDKVVRRFEAADSAFWQSRHLHFSATPLSEVVKQVNRIFDSEISLSKNVLGDCPLTADFDDPSLESLIQVVSATFNLEIQHAQSRIILTGEGCQ